MSEELVAGRRYKVRLKPKEELVEVGVEECHLQATWLKDYMDSQVGVLHYDPATTTNRVYEVRWADTFWYYRLEWLKILGEVD